jgi:putative transposase
MNRTLRYRTYPSRKQQLILQRQMESAKKLYNLLLEKAQKHFKDTGKTFTKYDMNKWITQLKRKNPEFSELYSQVLQNVADRVSKAYNNFFSRLRERKKGQKIKVGFPRSKLFVSSLTYPQFGFEMERKRVCLSKIGKINFVNHREIEGDAKTLSIKHTKSGQWFITVAVERNDKELASNGKPYVGMDLGLRTYATLSDGSSIENEGIKRQSEQKIARLHRRISSKKKGGRNRKKARIKLVRLSEHLARKSNDYLHKKSLDMVNSYSIIAYEGLNIRGMVKNHHLAKSINEASWNRFIRFLCYKAVNAGCITIEVNPRNTSKICSNCRNIEEISLRDRVFECGRCNIRMDRDLNASRNILNRAIAGQAKSYAFEDNASTLQRGDANNADELGTIYGVINNGR